MNTAEAARMAGVSTRQLLHWQAEGLIAPADNGRDGQGRRLDWSKADVEKAIEIKEGASKKSASEVVVDSLGGQDFLKAVAKTRGLQEKLLATETIVAGPRGVFVVPKKSLVEVALARVGSPMLVVERD